MSLTPKPVDLLGGSAGFGVPGWDSNDRTFLVVSDDVPDHGPVAPDHVMGVGGATRTLLTLTPRLPVGTALDLGCGCGAGALLLSSHAESVVASDISPRALAATAATLRLNDAPAALLVRGSLMDPFADASFDVVAADPPFVITPEGRLDYRDAPLPGDSLGPALLTGLARILRPGGWGVVLASWLHRADGPAWTEQVASWFPPGVAAWAAQRDQLAPDAYVDFWLRDAGQAADQQLRRAWLDHVATLGAEAVGFGWLVLHRPPAGDATGLPAQWVEDVGTASRIPTGAEVMAEFGRRAALPDAGTLLASQPRLAPGVRLTSPEFPVVAAVASPQAAWLTAPTGWRAPEPLDPPLTWWFRTAPGGPMADALDRCAAASGLAVDDVLVSWLVGVRVLMERGFATLDASPPGCSQ